MTTHFFDVTDIVLYVETETSISGIQRVSFEIIKRMVEHHGSARVNLTYWDRARRDYFCIPSDFINDMPEFDSNVLRHVFFGKSAKVRGGVAPTLEKYRHKPMKYRFHHLRRSYHARRGDNAHFRRHGSSLDEWRNFHTPLGPAPTSTSPPLERTPLTKIAKKGDQLVILGATWAIDGIDECFQHLKDNHGLEVTKVIHDLIPIITPEHIAGDFAKEFYRWLQASTGYCSRYIANSQNTARDLRVFMDEVGTIQPIDVIPLAQDFTLTSSPAPQTCSTPPVSAPGTYAHRLELAMGQRQSILNISKTPFVLVVGTLESRKNIWRLLQVWDRLVQNADLDMPKLVFAGKSGWQNDDFNRFLQSSGNLRGWVEIADRPSDTELAFLYKNCEFTVTVSFYEGWGLPIGESLYFGKTAVVANNSSMPEVGQDMVEYCDAQSISSIQDACRRLISDPKYRIELEARIAKTSLRTWDDVTSDFLAILSV